MKYNLDFLQLVAISNKQYKTVDNSNFDKKIGKVFEKKRGYRT